VARLCVKNGGFMSQMTACPRCALCAVAGDQSDVWRRDAHCSQCTQGGAVLRDGPTGGNVRRAAIRAWQFPFAHSALALSRLFA